MNKLLPKHFSICLYMGLLMLVFSGCKSKKGIVKAETPPSPPIDNMAELREKIATLEPQYQWLRMRASVDYEDPDKQYTGNANFRIKKNELLWSSINVLIEVARAQITPDSAVLLNRMEKSYTTMKANELQKLVAIEGLDLRALQNLLLAHPPFGLKEGLKLEKQENDKYILSKTDGLYREEIELDERNLKMTRYRFEKNTTQNVTVTYDDFKNVDKLLLPQKIVFTVASPEKITVTLNVTDYMLLDSDEAPFSIPANYKKAQ